MNDATAPRSVPELFDDVTETAYFAADAAQAFDDGTYAAVALDLCAAAFYVHRAEERLAARHAAKESERAA